MSATTRSRFYRIALAVFFVLASLSVGGYAISLLTEGARGHGTMAVNMFLMGFGLLLLVLTPLIFIVGIINWRKASDPEARDFSK